MVEKDTWTWNNSNWQYSLTCSFFENDKINRLELSWIKLNLIELISFDLNWKDLNLKEKCNQIGKIR